QILERRQLTLISGELVGVERPTTLLDPEDLVAGLSGLHCRCSEIVASFGGNVTRFDGGTILGCFGYPRAGEHDAGQAVRAGLALVEGVRDRVIAGRPIQLRIGIATGPVVVANFGEERRREGGLIGETVVLAAALRRTAEPGTVVIADNTRRLVGGLRGELAPDRFGEPVAAYTVLGAGAVASRFEAMHGPLLTPLVGREEEIE